MIKVKPFCILRTFVYLVTIYAICRGGDVFLVIHAIAILSFNTAPCTITLLSNSLQIAALFALEQLFTYIF